MARYEQNIPTGGIFDATTQICFGGDCSTIKNRNFNYRDIEIEYKSYIYINEKFDKSLGGTEARKKSILFNLLIAHKLLAILVADYVMDENTGYTLTNSVTSVDALGVAYLGKPNYFHPY